MADQILTDTQRKGINAYNFEFFYRYYGYEKITGMDVSLVYGHCSVNKSDMPVVADVGISSTLSDLHNWEVCCIIYQIGQHRSSIVTVDDSRGMQLIDELPIIARFLAFNHR